MTAAQSGAAPRAARLARCVAGLAGWRRAATAALLGALVVAAQPPVFAVPVLIVSFTGLVWLLDGARGRRQAFADGWLFGAGYFAVGLYWVSNALLVDAARFGWLIPFAILGLGFGLGLFVGATTLAARLLWPANVGRALTLAAAWAALEWVRGVILTGFPWNPVGNVWTAWLPVLQGASWVGVYGLSALTVFAAAAFAALDGGGRRRWLAALSGTAVLAVVAAAGAARLAGAPSDTVAGVRLRIVQPDISQRDKWLPRQRAENFALLMRLSGDHGGGAATDVIWPETAAPFGVTTDARDRRLLRAAVPPGGVLLTGAPRYRIADGKLARVWNSLVAVDDRGEVVGVYDKHHLVPFGEYMPLRRFLPIEKITPGSVDFSAGPGPVTMRVPGLPPFSPLICYEAIFPGEVARRDDRPDWLLNVTNDGWFGTSAGPHQHFASARMRAVEEGLPLVRAANTGISGVVDAYGRVRARLGLGERGVLDARLPASANTATIFARFGNVCLLPVIAIMLVAGVLLKRNSGLQKRETI